MEPYSIIMPTYRRPENFREHLAYLSNLDPEPEKILVTHVRNDKWTHRFDFEHVIPMYDNVDTLMFEDDPGLIETKFTPAWDYLETDFVFTCDDDIFPGQKYIRNVLNCYEEKPGIYGGMGFVYSETEFNKEVHGGWHGFPHDSYIHNDEITLVDSPGQSFFFNTNDVPYIDNKVLPDHFCNFCSDDLQLSWWAKTQYGTNTYVAPEPDGKEEVRPVKDLREQDIHEQSLVGSEHNDTLHKNKLVEYIQKEGYVIVEQR